MKEGSLHKDNEIIRFKNLKDELARRYDRFMEISSNRSNNQIPPENT
jgi:hypothetical protein